MPSSPSTRPGAAATRNGPRVAVVLASLLAAALLGGCTVAGAPAAQTDSSRRSGAVGAPGSALAALDELPVKGRAPKTGYDRDQFGPAWTDVDRNGCDTRNDVLARDLSATTVEAGTRGCVVLSGTLDDPYSGRDLSFVRGARTSAQVQIDHVVALGDAWQKGAQALDADTRTALAHDPLNLLAVDGPLNGAKGAGDAATWLPPNRGHRCAYVARQVAVKARYRLWVTPAERDASARVLEACPDEPLPTGGLDASGLSEEGPGRGGMDAGRRSAPAPGERRPPRPDPSPSYASCSEVRDAGAAPIRSGDPGFEPRFDRDGDGTGCDG